MKRYIKHNKSSRTPGNVMLVSTSFREHNEDGVRTRTLYQWHACHLIFDGSHIKSETLLSGSNRKTFWEMLEARKQKLAPLWIISADASVDARVLGFFEAFDNGDLIYNTGQSKTGARWRNKRTQLVIDGCPFFIRASSRWNQTIWLVCASNYISCTVDDLGETLGVFNHFDDTGTDQKHQSNSRALYRLDVLREYIPRIIAEWRDLDCGNWRQTIAGLSFANFRHWVCDDRSDSSRAMIRHNILIDSDHPSDELERRGYMGGRCEAFFIGKYPGKVYHLDFRAFYPSIMESFRMPVEMVDSGETIDSHKLDRILEDYYVIADVLFYSGRDTFPIRDKRGLLYAYGLIRTTLSGHELERMLRRADIREIGPYAVYETAPIFREWAAYWLSRRQRCEISGDKAGAIFAKNIANSLYGKFGQRAHPLIPSGAKVFRLPGGQTIRWGKYYERTIGSDEIIEHHVHAGVDLISVGDHPARESFTPISSCITSIGREKISDIISACPHRSVLYCNTDSLIVNALGYDFLKSNGYIAQGVDGMLQLKGIHDECEIRGNNYYILDGKVTVAGLYALATLGEDGISRAMIDREGMSLNKCYKTHINIEEIIVHAPLGKPKGNITKDGWVLPFDLTKDPEFVRET